MSSGIYRSGCESGLSLTRRRGRRVRLPCSRQEGASQLLSTRRYKVGCRAFSAIHRASVTGEVFSFGRYEAWIARVTITARPAIFMPAVTKLPDIIPSHWVRKAQIKPILYWTIFLESGGEICSLLDKNRRRLRYEIRKELQVERVAFG